MAHWEFGLKQHLADATPHAGLGLGDVSGPGTSTDNEIARFHLATGKVIQASVTPVTISDAGTVNVPAGQGFTVGGAAIDHGGLGGLADDDHAQYLKEAASGGTATETPDHTHVSAAECGTLTLAGAAFPNQGTTVTVLHGNAGGNPSWGSVANADLRDSAALTVIGRSANSAGDPADIAGATVGHALQVAAGPVLAFGAVTGKLLAVQVKTVGAGNVTSNALATKWLIRMVAGGGGGGGVTGNVGESAAGGGGGSGGYLEKLATVAPSTNYAYVVGDGGAGGSAVGPAAGSTGADTTLTIPATTYTTKGGLGGSAMASATSVAITAAGAGGAISTNGDVNCGGDAGIAGTRLSGSVNYSGKGGVSHFGGGAVGQWAAVGTAGIGFGGGGSGAGTQDNTDRAGGKGAPGVIVIYEFT